MAVRTKVCGLGINDADYVTSPKVNGKQVPCPVYNVWKGMFDRCYKVKPGLKNHRYRSCSVDERWHRFSSFRQWYLSWEGDELHIDKDILVRGNRIYGPETCLRVPLFVNNCFRSSKEGEHSDGLPMGVSAPKAMSSSPKPFMACAKTEGPGSRHLGHFATKELAHRAWQMAKITGIYATATRYLALEHARESVFWAILARAQYIENDMKEGKQTVWV